MSRFAGPYGAHSARAGWKKRRGRGVLLGGVPAACRRRDVLVLGGGVAGSHAPSIAAGMGEPVTVVDRNPEVRAGSRSSLRSRVEDGFLDPRRHRGTLPAGRSRGRDRAGAGRGGAKLISARDRQGHEARLRHRRLAIDQAAARDFARPRIRTPTWWTRSCHIASHMPGAVAATSTLRSTT